MAATAGGVVASDCTMLRRIASASRLVVRVALPLDLEVVWFLPPLRLRLPMRELLSVRARIAVLRATTDSPNTTTGWREDSFLMP